LVLLVASVLAGALSSEGSSLQLRSQHSLGSSLRSEGFQRLLETCDQEGQSCTDKESCCLNTHAFVCENGGLSSDKICFRRSEREREREEELKKRLFSDPPH
jgi:hypothetical protein